MNKLQRLLWSALAVLLGLRLLVWLLEPLHVPLVALAVLLAIACLLFRRDRTW